MSADISGRFPLSERFAYSWHDGIAGIFYFFFDPGKIAKNFQEAHIQLVCNNL
jgi:hypothetical protein